MTLTESQRS